LDLFEDIQAQAGATVKRDLCEPYFDTAGASGTGTIMGIVIKGLAPGTSSLSIVQVSAKDSQQRPIQLVTSEASVQVAP
jgi:hypothetical protein